MARALAANVDDGCNLQVTVVDILFHLCCLFYWMHEFREATKCELIGVEDVWQFAIEKALLALSQVDHSECPDTAGQVHLIRLARVDGQAFAQRHDAMCTFTPGDRLATIALQVCKRHHKACNLCIVH